MSDKKYLQEIYNLSLNPFESRTDPDVPMAGRKAEKRAWTEVVDKFRGGRANSINFIVGDYGFGKTLSLFKILEQYEDNEEILKIHMKMLPEDRVSKFGVDFIQRLFRGVKDNIYHRFRKEDLEQLIQIFPEVGKVFTIVSHLDKQARFFIQGEISPTASQLKRLGIIRKMDSTAIAQEYLLGFLFLIKGLGIKTVLVAVDEVEYVFSQMRGTSISLVFNTIRVLNDILKTPDARNFDPPPANIIFFFGISDGGMSNLLNLGEREAKQGGPIQPLIRRFREKIVLNPLNPRETRELIELRLRLNRITDEYEDKPLIPYDESFVEFVNELSIGNPGEVVKYCDYALEEGIREKAKLLTKEFAQKAFLYHGLISESEE